MVKCVQIPDMAAPEAAVIELVNYLYTVNAAELRDVIGF